MMKDLEAVDNREHRSGREKDAWSWLALPVMGAIQGMRRRNNRGHAKMPAIFVLAILLLTGCKERQEKGLTLTLTAGVTTVSADTGKVQLIAELKDETGNGVEGAQIIFEASAGTLSEVIELGDGRYSVILSNLKTPAISPVHVTASYNELSDSIDIKVIPGVPYNLDLMWEPAQANADSGEVTFTAKVTDYNGNPVPDAELLFTSSYGTFKEFSYTGQGEYRTTLIGLTDTRRSPVQVLCRSGYIQKTVEVKIKPGALKTFSISPVLDPQYVNEPFSLFALAADKNGNIVDSFNGTVNIIPSDSGVVVNPSVSSPFVNGILRQENITISSTSSALTLRLDNGGGIFGITNPFDVIMVPSVDHFTIEPVPETITAGVPFNLILTARDASNSIVTDFNGTVTISDTTSTIFPTISQKFKNGILAQQVSITKAMTGVTITVTGSTGGSGNSNSFNVIAGALDHFKIDNVSSPKLVNAPFPIIVTAVDKYDNPVTSFSDTVQISDTTGTIIPRTSGNFSDGTLVQQVKIGKVTSQNVIKVKDSQGRTGESNPFEVTGVDVDHFTISAISSPQTAGSTFTIIIEAKDALNNTVTEFNGTVTLRDGTKTVEPVISRPFVSGLLVQDVTITKAMANNTITVLWNGKTGNSNAFDVNPGNLNRFLFSTIPSPVTAGQSFSVTVEAVDLYGNRVNYNGTVGFSDLTGSVTATNTTFANGVLNTNITISRTFQSDIIIVSDGSITGTSNAFEVRHGALDHFSFDADPDTPGIQGISGPQRNGSPFTIRVYARDSANQLVSDFNGTVILSDLTGTITPASGAFNNGVMTLSVTISANRAGNTISVSDGFGHTGVSNSFDVVSGSQVQCFDIDPVGTPQVAGQPFQIAITARKTDCNGAVDNSFNGNVNLVDTTGTLKPYQSANFVNGVLTQMVTIPRSGNNIRITVEGAGLAYQSNPFTVVPGGLNHFSVSQVASPQQVDIPFGITITAVDAFNNRVTGFNGTVKLTDKSGALNITSNPFIFGLLNQNITLSKAITGNHIWVDDLAGHTGASNSFDVFPQPVDHFAISNILSPRIEDEPFSITLVAQDASGRTVRSFDGNVSLEDTTGSVSPSVSDYFIGGILTQEIKIGVPTASTLITVSDGAGHTGQSNSFAVEPSYAGVSGYTIDLIPTPQVAGQQFTITIRAVDVNGETVTGFNGLVTISDTTGTISPSTSQSFNRGIVSQPVTITRAMSNVRISVQDIAGNTGTSNPFNVIPGELDHLAIAEIPSPQRVNVPFTISITAQDAYNNTVTGFNGTVNLIDLTTTIQPTTSAPFSAGILNQQITISAAFPADTITVVEPESGATGTSNVFVVEP